MERIISDLFEAMEFDFNEVFPLVGTEKGYARYEEWQNAYDWNMEFLETKGLKNVILSDLIDGQVDLDSHMIMPYLEVRLSNLYLPLAGKVFSGLRARENQTAVDLLDQNLMDRRGQVGQYLNVLGSNWDTYALDQLDLTFEELFEYFASQDKDFYSALRFVGVV